MNVVCLVFCGVVLAFCRMLGGEGPNEAIVWVLIAIFSVFYLSSLWKTPESRDVASALCGGYCLRLFFVMVDIYLRNYFLLPNSGADTEMFYYGAIRVMQGGESHRGFFVYVMAAVFQLFGVSRLWGQFLIMLCSMAALHFAYRSLVECKVQPQISSKVMTILCLLPNSALLSSLFLREALIYMFLSISMYCFILWMTRSSEKCYLLAFAFAFGAMRFHSGTVAVPIGYFIARFLYNSEKHTFSFSAKNIIISVMFLAIAGFVAARFEDAVLGKMSSVESLEDIANVNTMGGSNYSQYVGNSSSPVHFVLFTPLRIFFFLFSPLPIFWRGLADVIAFCFSSCFYLLVICKALKFLRNYPYHDLRRCIVMGLLIVAACAAFVFGWGVSNAGTACRHREKMAIFYAVIWALSLQSKEHVNNTEFVAV